MATDLTNVAVSTGYVQLLHIDGGVGGSATRVYDGDGTGTPLEISTTELVIKDGSFNLNVASHDGTNGLKLGGTLVTTSAAELNLLDGITAGTVSASKFLLVDSNKDLSGLRNLTATGTIQAANFTGTGNTQIGDAAADTVAMNATITTNLIFEGSTDNAYETTLAITDPTADRTWTIPDATDTSVGRATTDTLTNKTLTAPDINTPDIDGGTVDAITSLTVANSVDIGNYTLTANGLTIDGTFTDGTLSIASGSISSAVNGTFSGTVQAEQLTTTDDATISDQLSVDGTMTISTGSIVDSTGTISFGDENLTTTGVGTFASLDISGNADIDGTMEADAYTVDGTALNEYIADTVGAMVGSNTETNITVTYEDGDNTLDFVIGTLNQDTTGTADNFTVSANNSSDETVYPIFVDGATGSQGAESDTGLTYNPSSGLLTITGELDAGSLDISGNADIDGTLEADAITVDGTTLAEYISDTTGAMVSSNTESGITVTYQDGDNTIDFSVDAAQTGITSLLATDIKIGEDDQTKIDFEDADKINFYAGNEKQLILEDGALYPGSDNIIDLGKSDNEFKDAFFDGTVTADAFAGPITGAVTGNADTATLATTVTVSDSTANTNFPVVFHNESNALLDDTGALRYNPSTGELLVPKLTVAGTTTTVDTVTMNAQNAIIFEGATSDTNETTLSIVDPTADHTQYLINQGGYIPVLAAATTTAITSTPAELNILDDATVTTAELNLIDGGTARGTTAVASGDGILINDGGTMRMTNVDTVSTYFSSHNVGGGNIVTTGALSSGSIASGFGAISTGNAITTTGVGTFASLDISGNVDVDGTLEADAITVDSTALNEYIADTVGAMVGSNTETGIAVTYEDGDNTLDFVLGTTQTTVTSMLNASLVAGRDADNQIKFSTDDEIIFRVAGGDGVTMKASGEIEATSLDVSGNIAVDGNITMADDTSIGISDSDERIEFDGAGDISVLGANFGIGTSPQRLFHIHSGGSGDTSYMQFTQDGTGATSGDGLLIGINANEQAIIYNQEDTDLMFYTNQVERMRLDSNSRISLSNSDSGTGNTLFGKSAGANLDAGSNYNVFIGDSVSDATMNDASNNVGIGYQALSAATTGDDNVIIGSGAAVLLTTGKENVVVGSGAYASANTSENYGVAIGFEAAKLLDGIDNVTAVGYKALSTMVATDGNTALGFEAGKVTTGGYNTYIGFKSGKGASGADANNTAVGHLSLTAITDGAYNTVLGAEAGEALTTGDENVFIGLNAGDTTTDVDKTVIIGANAGGADLTSGADGTVAIGYQALTALTGGAGNVAVGQHALSVVTGNNHSTAVGHQALQQQLNGSTDAVGNTAMGYQAGRDLTTSTGSTLVGYKAGGGATMTGVSNTAVGYDAGVSLTSGYEHVLLGWSAGKNMNSCNNNIAIGRSAMEDATTQSICVAIGGYAGKNIEHNDANGTVLMGYYAGFAITNGRYNVGIGHEALMALATEDKNTALGTKAGTALTGASNTCIGHKAGYQIVGGSGNTLIGESVDVNTANFTNATGIGYNFEVTGSNSVFLGNSDVDDVYMAVDSGASVHCKYINAKKTSSDGSATRVSKFWNDGDNANYGGITIQCGADNQSGTTVFLECDDGDGQSAGTLSNVSGTFQLTDASDIRLKENVVDTAINGLETVNAMKVRDFDWKKSGIACSAGFIANELAEVFAPAVTGEPDAMKTLEDGTEEIAPMTVSRERLVPVLIKAVQELSAENNDLKSRIEALENK